MLRRLTFNVRHGESGRQVLVRLYDLLFPRECVACSSPLSAGPPLCPSCLATLGSPPPPLPIGESGDLEVRALLTHAGAGRELVHALKYRERRDVARFLAARARDLLPESGSGTVLIPIPLHPRRERARGYNQSAILAEAIAATIPGVVLAPRAVVRRQPTRSQTKLDRQARRANMADAFALGEAGVLRGRTVLLVDDVVTTGATLEAAASAIRPAGPAALGALVAARAELD